MNTGHAWKIVHPVLLIGNEDSSIKINKYVEYQCKNCKDILPHFYMHCSFEEAVGYLVYGNCDEGYAAVIESQRNHKLEHSKDLN